MGRTAPLAALALVLLGGCADPVATETAPTVTGTGYQDPAFARARAMADLDRAQYDNAPSSQCGPRSPVFVGGSTYCVGTHQ